MPKSFPFLAISLLLAMLSACQGSIEVPETKETYLKARIVLASIEFDGVTLNDNFTADKTIYTATVENNITSIQVTPNSDNTSFTIAIDETNTTSGTSTNIPLDEGENVIKVSVSEDDFKKVYQFTITRAKIGSIPSTPSNPGAAQFDSASDISALTFSSGTLIPGFSNTTLNYTLVLDSNIENITVKTSFISSSSVTINDVSLASSQTSADFPMAIGNNPLNILIKAGNGAEKKYTITAIRFDPETPVVTPIYDLNLASLNISQGTLSPEFSSGVYDYTVTVEADISAVKITLAAFEIESTITINNATANSGQAGNDIALSPGENVINIETKRSTGETRKYTISISRKIALNNNQLSAITISAGSLSPAFSSETTDYNVAINSITDNINIEVTRSDNRAAVMINGHAETTLSIPLIEGDNQIKITVTAEDGSIKTYALTATKASPGNDSNLSSLTISDSNGSQSLDTNQLTQTSVHAIDITSVTITPTTSSSVASMSVNGTPLLSGNSSRSISLGDTANNPIIIIVTAENETTKTFTITAINAGTSDLKNMTLSTSFLDQAFQSNQTSYTSSVGYIADTIKFTAELDDASSSMTINGISTADGAESQPISLEEGSNVVNITVTANDATNQTYSIDVTRKTAASLTQQFYLKASNPVGISSSPHFGFATAIDGDTLVVGSSQEGSATTGINGNATYDCSLATRTNCVLNSGAVYVFIRSDGTWTQQAYIKPSNTQIGARFGQAVALNGNVLVVGAHLEDTDNNDSGAVYIYRRSGSIWAEEALLKASNASSGDEFGVAVGISGNSIVVGARDENSENGLESNNSGDDTGAAYVFFHNGTNWNQQAYLKPSVIDNNDFFGTSVAIYNDTIAVAATGESSSTRGINGDKNLDDSFSSGAVYIFSRTETSWTETSYLKASNTNSLDLFGISIALDNKTLAVGARGQDGAGTGVNASQTTSGASNSGAVYIFLRNNSDAWAQQAYIKSSNTGPEDFFYKVALSGNTLIVGAAKEASNATGINGTDNNSATDSGAAYVFKRTGSTWLQTHYLKASNTNANDEFGQSVSADGDTLIVGAHLEDSGGTGTIGNELDNSKSSAGAVYIFQ